MVEEKTEQRNLQGIERVHISPYLASEVPKKRRLVITKYELPSPRSAPPTASKSEPQSQHFRQRPFFPPNAPMSSAAPSLRVEPMRLPPEQFFPTSQPLTFPGQEDDGQEPVGWYWTEPRCVSLWARPYAALSTTIPETIVLSMMTESHHRTPKPQSIYQDHKSPIKNMNIKKEKHIAEQQKNRTKWRKQEDGQKNKEKPSKTCNGTITIQ